MRHVMDLYHRNAVEYSFGDLGGTAHFTCTWAGRAGSACARDVPSNLGLVEGRIIEGGKSREDCGCERVLTVHKIQCEDAPGTARSTDGGARDLIDHITQLTPCENLTGDSVGQEDRAAGTVAPAGPVGYRCPRFQHVSITVDRQRIEAALDPDCQLRFRCR